MFKKPKAAQAGAREKRKNKKLKRLKKKEEYLRMRRQAVAHQLFITNENNSHNKKGKGFATFFTAFFITVVMLTATAGIMLADKNTKAVSGFMGDQELLSAGMEDDILYVTVFNNVIGIDKAHIERISNVCRRVGRFYGSVKPEIVDIYSVGLYESIRAFDSLTEGIIIPSIKKYLNISDF